MSYKGLEARAVLESEIGVPDDIRLRQVGRKLALEFAVSDNLNTVQRESMGLVLEDEVMYLRFSQGGMQHSTIQMNWHGESCGRYIFSCRCDVLCNLQRM